MHAAGIVEHGVGRVFGTASRQGEPGISDLGFVAMIRPEGLLAGPGAFRWFQQLWNVVVVSHQSGRFPNWLIHTAAYRS